VRCGSTGHIPDLGYAVTNLLTTVTEVPPLTWGLDELHAVEMWNSKSLIAWLLARIGHPAATIRPPTHGRGPPDRTPA
jgi:hypothetical protein